MLSFLLVAAKVLLVVSHDAAARGQTRLLEKFADRAELIISLDGGAARGNAIADSAVESIARWPALVAVELRLPLVKRDAVLLRRVPRLAVRLPPRTDGETESPFIPLGRARREEPSLALLGPSLVRAERTPPGTLGPGPCPGTEERVVPGGGSEVRIAGEVSRCLIDWLHARLDPHAEPLGEPMPAPKAAPPAKKSPRR